MTPLKSDVVPRVACPAICQKIFFATAPPARVTIAPFATVRSWATWKIHTSFGPPLSVTPAAEINTPVPHL